jgi:FMN phosphatase YigB (HAD superfamily)
MKKDKIILTDADGVCLDWEWAFGIWMSQHGFKMVDDGPLMYNVAKRYGLPKEQGRVLVKRFNESAAIGFLPSLRDAQYYIKRLHEEWGYKFHMISSLSTDENAQELRKMNTRKLFGEDTFSHFIFLDTGADKDEVLKEYEGSGLLWVEDKYHNAIVGHELGLRSIVMEHGHNMDFDHQMIPRVKNWKQIYELVVKSL